MNITFLIGNGFDRALGLETGYWKFYEWYVNQPADGLKEHVIEFRSEIDKYVRKASDAKPYWSDVELGLGCYSEKFSLGDIEDFFECYEDLRDNLITYLQQQEARLYTENIGVIRRIFALQMSNVLEQVDAAERPLVLDLKNTSNDKGHNFNFISFNYTRAFDKVHSVFTATESGVFGTWRNSNGNTSQLKVGKLIHVHGYMDRWPILGVCGQQSIKNQELLKNDEFAALMLKSESIRETGELWRVEVEQLIKVSTIICVFGMSLGDTDSDYWEMLSNWLAADSKHQLVVFWRNTKLKNFHVSILEKKREVASVRKTFLEHSTLTEEAFNKIKPRIHVVINTDNLFYLTDEELKNLVAPTVEEMICEIQKAQEQARMGEIKAQFMEAYENAMERSS